MRPPSPLSVLLSCAFLLLAGRCPVSARLISIRGDTTVRRSGNSYFVQTGPNERAALLFLDGSVVKLNTDTTLEVPAPTPTPAVAPTSPRLTLVADARSEVLATLPEMALPLRLVLHQGEIWEDITPRREITTELPGAQGLRAEAEAEPRGTELSLRLARDGTATLTVAEGSAVFTNAQGSATVRKAQQSMARPGEAPTQPVAVNLPFMIEWTNDLQPVAFTLEPRFVSQDPARWRTASQEAEALPRGYERSRRLGDVFHDRADLREALAAYESARAALGAEAPKEARAALAARVGQTHLELEELPQAEASFRQSLELDPGGTVARTGLVIVLLSQRDTDRAQSRRRSALALAESREAVERDESSPVAHTALALAQIHDGERDMAQRELSRAVALAPDYAPARVWQSFLLRAQGRLDEARAVAKRAVALAPFSSLARLSLSDAAFALGRISEARQAAERAVALNPHSLGASVSLVRAFLQEGSLDQAVREANRAVKLAPDRNQVRFFLGVSLAERGQLERAADQLRQAVALDSDSLESRVWLARVYLRQGRGIEAIEVAREALARQANYAPARAALGQVYRRAGRLKEARAEYRVALEQAPGSPLYHLELARLSLDENDLPDALEEGLAAVNAAPGSGEAHALLGLIYGRMGTLEQALREYRVALSLAPDNALARLGLGTSHPMGADRLREIRRALGPGQSGQQGGPQRESADADRERPQRLLQLLAGELGPVDGLQEVAQGILRDPSVLADLFEPGVASEIAPLGGSSALAGVDFTHRDQWAHGTLRDLTFGDYQRSENYRNHHPEKLRMTWLNLTGSPGHRAHVLGQYLSTGSEYALPGPISDPDRDDRGSFRDREWDLSARYRVNANTSAWLRAGSHASRFVSEDPDAPGDLLEDSGELGVRSQVLEPSGNPTGLLFRRSRLRQLALEGRLDYHWGRRFTASYAFLAGRDRLESRERSYSPGLRGFEEEETHSRFRTVSHTLQGDLRAGSRLSVILGLSVERFSERSRLQGAVESDREAFEEAVTSWLPFGQATYVATERDLFRLIAHRRRRRLSSPILQPTEAFLVAEPPSLALGGEATNYEIDYERRLSSRSFGKLFFFRSDVDDLLVTPPVRQTLDLVNLSTARARSEGAGVRYERQIRRFLSGFARYTYREVTDRMRGPAQLPMIPRARALVGLNYVDRAGTKLLVETDWQGKMSLPPLSDGQEPPEPLRAKWVVNLRFGQERSVRREWAVRVYNLLNTKTLYWHDFPAPGRTFELTYRLRY